MTTALRRILALADKLKRDAHNPEVIALCDAIQSLAVKQKRAKRNRTVYMREYMQRRRAMKAQANGRIKG